MIVDAMQFVSGVENEKPNGITAPVNAAEVKGFNGSPLVMTSDEKSDGINRETYDLQTMIDPGDEAKEREINHMYPGNYRFVSDTYVNLPKNVYGEVRPNKRLLENGCTVEAYVMPGFKGLIQGVLNVNGGELFFEPGEVIGELVTFEVAGK